MNTLKKLLLSGSTMLLLAACGGETTEEPAVEDAPADPTEQIEEAEDTAEQTEEDTTGQTEEDPNEQISADDLELFTEEEIAEYNGQDGNPAYVAVEDVVYDVTDANGWENGVHEGGIEAGNVYTEADFEGSPHGTEVLDNVPIVGTIDSGQ